MIITDHMIMIITDHMIMIIIDHMIMIITDHMIMIILHTLLLYHRFLMRELFSYNVVWGQPRRHYISPGNTIGKLFPSEKTIICLVNNILF